MRRGRNPGFPVLTLRIGCSNVIGTSNLDKHLLLRVLTSVLISTLSLFVIIRVIMMLLLDVQIFANN